MSIETKDLDGVDLTGARLHRVDLEHANFRFVGLSDVVMRGVELNNATIDGDIFGLVINGVEVAPLIEAEWVRREPARVGMTTDDPAELRAAWEGVQAMWAATYDRVEAMPPGTVDIGVDGEWSFAQTLRHLVFATDAWLGATRGEQRSFHPWGVPFTGVYRFAEPAELIDPDAAPSYAEVLELRAERVGQLTALLAGATPERLAERVVGPLWAPDPTVLDCVHVIIEEELEHHRFAVRDLDAIEAGTTS
jgi:hypothetical protein